MHLCLLIFVCVGDRHISRNLQQSLVLVRSFSFFEAIEFHIVTFYLWCTGYFMRLADPGADKSWKGNSSRAFSELPYHLVS